MPRVAPRPDWCHPRVHEEIDMSRAARTPASNAPICADAMPSRAWRRLGESLLEGTPGGLAVMWSAQWLVVLAVVALLCWTWR
jgi:hypothetical protein